MTIPNCDYQIDFVCGLAIDRFGPAGSNIFYSAQSRLLSADNGGTQVCGTDCVSGTVFNDNNGDGKQQSGECGIDGVTITLTGKDCKGNAVYLCTTTDTNGNYCFTGLQASDSCGYTITEAKPSDYTHEGQTAGCTGGTTDDCTITTFVNTNTCSSGNNFCETQSISGSNLTCGDTGIVDFWNSRDGQNLIKSLNGGSRSKNLANWLACTFPDLYGRNSFYNLAGRTNRDVASYFQSLSSQRGQQTSAAILATALSVYVTDSDLAGTVATSYGFNVSTLGTGAKMFDVGSDGTAIGLSNYTRYEVMTLLQQADSLTGCNRFVNSALYDIFNGILTAGSPAPAAPATATAATIMAAGDGVGDGDGDPRDETEIVRGDLRSTSGPLAPGSVPIGSDSNRSVDASPGFFLPVACEILLVDVMISRHCRAAFAVRPP